MGTVIIQRLDLALKLMDATTGYSISDKMARFIVDGKDVRFIPRGDDHFILLNYGRVNMTLQIVVNGYETKSVSINYEELDETCPMKVIFLIPSENSYLREGILTLKGRIPGLRSISLIQRNMCVAHTDTYDPKKKIMTVFERGYRLRRDGSTYGILDTGNVGFCVFEVVKQPTENSVVLKSELAGEFRRNAPIYRIVEGYVDPDGSYLLAVRDDGADKKTYVRVETGEVRFAEVDFHNLEGITL